MVNKLSEKQEVEKNVVIPNITTFCKANRSCCIDEAGCSGTYTMNPNGQTAFYRCGC